MNDLIWNGCTFQGPVKVVHFDDDGNEHLLYKGDGEEIPYDEDWGEPDPIYIYYDNYDECICIEL